MSTNERLFRKVSLDRLSSPDRLDALASLYRSKGWMLWFGLGILLLGTAAWAWFGVITVKASGRCILISPRGIADVSSNSDGRIIDLAVKLGDTLKAGQLVARVVRPELYDEISMMRARLADLQKRRDEIKAYSAVSLRYGTQLRESEEKNLAARVALAEDRKKAAESRLAVERGLFAQGLLTKQALLATEQQVSAAALEMEATKNQLKQLSVQQLEEQRRLQNEVGSLDLQVNDADRSLDSLLSLDAQTSRVITPFAGRVIEIRTTNGMPVGVGGVILAIERASDQAAALQAVIFVDAGDGKRIRPGMPAEIVPSTVKRQEFGFLRARVTQVSEFPASSLGMRLMVQNDAIVRELTQGKTPMQLDASLDADAATGSYVWSAAAHQPPPVRSGTLCDADVVIAQKRPLSEFVPAMRRWIGLS
ncbi:MAG: NHLP bacteriocin system secretion protein [Burkholderiales bacterium]|jgi:HlyD family secretion protein